MGVLSRIVFFKLTVFSCVSSAVFPQLFNVLSHLFAHGFGLSFSMHFIGFGRCFSFFLLLFRICFPRFLPFIFKWTIIAAFAGLERNNQEEHSETYRLQVFRHLYYLCGDGSTHCTYFSCVIAFCVLQEEQPKPCAQCTRRCNHRFGTTQLL